MFKKKIAKDGTEVKKKIFAPERLYSYGIWLLGRKDYTTFEMTQKMKNYQPDEKIIQETIDKLVSHGYINDERRATNIVNAYIKKESSYKIKRRLSEKGVSKDMIEDVIRDSVDEGVEIEMASKMLIKKFKYFDKEKKQKYCAYLVGRGYSWDVISKAIDHLKKESTDYD
jgi:regulatory protein